MAAKERKAGAKERKVAARERKVAAKERRLLLGAVRWWVLEDE